MADACEVPLGVHGDDDSFAGVEYLVRIVDGEVTLVDPVEVYDIGPFKLYVFCDIGACIGYVDKEEVALAELVGGEDTHTFPQELDGLCPSISYRNDGQLVSLLIPDEHSGLDSVLLQGLHESVGCYGGSTDAF